MSVSVFVVYWGRKHGSTGLRDDKVAALGHNDNVGLTAVFWLVKILHANVQQVATMLMDISADFSIDRTQNGRDIWQ